MFSLSSFYQYPAKYSFQASGCFSTKETIINNEIGTNAVAPISTSPGKESGKAMDRTSDPFCSQVLSAFDGATMGRLTLSFDNEGKKKRRKQCGKKKETKTKKPIV